MTTGCAGTFTAGVRTGDYRVERQPRAYARGYDVGVEKGRGDARSGRRLDYERHREFRNGTKGYNRRDGDRGEYRGAFRDGFVGGYNDAYRENARNRDRDDDRDRRRRR